MTRLDVYDIEAEELFREEQHERLHASMALVDPRDPAYVGCECECLVCEGQVDL